MGLLVVRVAPGGLNIPTGQVAVMALIAIALFRRPTRSLYAVSWLPLTGVALLGFLAVESWSNGADFTRRLTNLAVLLVMAGFLVSGRIDVGSAVKGLTIAAALNVVLFYLRVAPNEYEGKLTGFLQDKNASGLFYAVVPLLATMVVTRTRSKVAVLVVGAACLVATDSRTSMAAYAAAVIWLVWAGRLGRIPRVALATGLAAAFSWANGNLAEIGQYATERSGSDALRARIDVAAVLKADGAPWYGRGLGQAFVDLEGSQWFFHNSYDALRVEGGIVMLVAVLVLYAVGGLCLSRRDAGPLGRDGLAVSAATLVVLFCANRLGEVFLAPIGLVVLGVGAARLAAAAGLPPRRPAFATRAPSVRAPAAGPDRAG